MSDDIENIEYIRLLNEGSERLFAARAFNYDSEMISELNFNKDGLIPAIVQDRVTRHVLMMAWMDRTALEKTLDTGRSWFYSRSRNEYWQKGETSGDRQYVNGVFFDCDQDVLLVVVDQEGKGACHTGNWTCFYRELSRGPN